jgi:transposase
MTQRDRDRLVALKKAREGLIMQRQAAEEIGQSERHVRRLLYRLKGKGDAALVHALRGRQSNRKLDEKTKQKALEILRRDIYRGFGPTLAAEYLDSKHDIQAGRETVRTWMIEGKRWRASRQRVDKIHPRRPRSSRVGELVRLPAAFTARFDGRKHAAGVELRGVAWPAGQLLHRQGELVSNGAENGAGGSVAQLGRGDLPVQVRFSDRISQRARTIRTMRFAWPTVSPLASHLTRPFGNMCIASITWDGSPGTSGGPVRSSY